MLDPLTPPDLKGVVPGTSAVETVHFQLVQHLCDQVLALAGILLVRGPGGSGKTYAVTYWTDRASVPVVFLHLLKRTSDTAMLRAILSKLDQPTDGTGEILGQRASGALVGRELVIFVDEANLLNLEALRTLRYLHDQKQARFALVMTGVDFGRPFAGIPEFSSRLKREVRFEPLTGSVLMTALAATHPTLAKTDRQILRAIDRQYAHGLWRHWANVLEYALTAGATPDTGITAAIARGMLGGLPSDRSSGKRGR